ncbi:MAG: RfaE bifunctional protein [uncultured bacterium (gcode 4)]|uniref:RfaE bifunctional protein n=1 Tax=uncultured bacterium (gcode 4) TaxID=1234023 RepID=K2AWZ3_9BACT|nr:MAG: RfaE bifunctional protein [uncultured bacterium (gcode 4)]
MIINSEKELIQEVVKLKSQWKKIITTNGCFDIIHPGHIETFRQAKNMWDILIVLVNSDANPYFQTKPGRPINDEVSRKIMLDAIKYIDFVYPFPEQTPVSLLEKIQPAIHVKGWDYIKENLPEYAVIKQYWGDIEIIPTVWEYSTTGIIERIMKVYG